jgi:hypothetical protein
MFNIEFTAASLPPPPPPFSDIILFLYKKYFSLNIFNCTRAGRNAVFIKYPKHKSAQNTKHIFLRTD